MKISMILGGLLYIFRGTVVLFPFAIAAMLGVLPVHPGSSATSLTTEEPLWVLGGASIFIAFLEEHYFREKEYEAFVISLVGTALIFSISAIFYTDAVNFLPIVAYALFSFGVIDFILGLEYHKPGHKGRMKKRTPESA
ncbi:MAG: hypothetical protein KIY11_02810 [Thermoplasmata archaeon]|nr:hypothetical protein [Candidatus Sysuiplasma acidicola]